MAPSAFCARSVLADVDFTILWERYRSMLAKPPVLEAQLRTCADQWP
jgi:hypothetical protein